MTASDGAPPSATSPEKRHLWEICSGGYLSVAETAQLTGMSESAVKVGVHRGLKALAALIRGKL